MSDQSDVPTTEPEEAAQAAATQEPVSESPPWGDDFDAERAWKTIQNLRQFEKPAKEFERIQSDEDARTEWLKSQGYEIADDDEDAETSEEEDDDGLEFETDDPVQPLTEKLTRLEQWQADQQAKESAEAIRRDLDEFNTDTDWELDDEDRQAIVERAARQNPKGFGPTELKQAHEWFVKRLDRAAETGVERAKKPGKPKPPHVTRGGKAATETPGWTDMSWEQQAEEMARRVQANAQ